VELLNGNCLELMKDIEDGSVDMILCDLPYGTTACKWDTVIPFEPLWEQYERIIKKKGAIVLFGSQPFTSKLVMSKINLFKYCLVWEKERATNFLNFKYQFGKSHEDICVFGLSATSYTKKGVCMSYYPQMKVGTPYTQKQGRAGNAIARDKKTRNNSVQTINKGERYPLSVLSFNTERGLHPTQKPVALLEYLIKTYTQENELVLDNTMGSGSTGIACLNTKRQFIGMELNKTYFEIAKKRIEEHQRQLKLFA
jgi:site-specific DNA-methyltransferase (adenine-specific)